MAILWTHPIIMGGGGVGCLLNKWFFINKIHVQICWYNFEIMERYCNIVIHSGPLALSYGAYNAVQVYCLGI